MSPIDYRNPCWSCYANGGELLEYCQGIGKDGRIRCRLLEAFRMRKPTKGLARADIPLNFEEWRRGRE